ncbi:hypothetical protein KKB83_04100 [Patescibacteria group bacterium]|nr:hypothetical protein [Patescibacteria group bacterium]
MNENKTKISEASPPLETRTLHAGVIRIDLWKALAIIFTAVLGSAGTAIWGTLAIANTIPFRVDALEKQIEEVKVVVESNNDKFMPLDLSIEKWKNNDKQHDEIIRRLDVIQTTLSRL